MTSRPSPAAGLIDYIKALPQYLLPHYALSNLMFKLTRSKTIWWKNFFIRWFIDRYHVDMSEAVLGNAADYPSFNDFFTRALKAGARSTSISGQHILCPVDGYVSQMGKIKQGNIFQAKGQDYSLSELLADQQDWLEQFADGEFATLYLSPKNYHRIHMPCSAQLTQMTYIPGRLFSVNPATARTIPRLFSRNERVVTHFITDNGPMIMVLVGAIFVGGMETTWHGVITPPHGARLQHWHYKNAATVSNTENTSNHDHAVEFKQADEMGRFNMGSTVILLFPKDTIHWDELSSGAPIVMGQHLATLTSPTDTSALV